MRFIKSFFNNRKNVLIIVFLLEGAILLGRLFSLQIVRGEDYQNNYRLKVRRQEIIPATRGVIYDRNGNPLAYNKLANAVTIEDIGTYRSESERNSAINAILYDVIKALIKNGDSIYLDFGIVLDPEEGYIFRDTGTRQMRFRADVFGHSSINDLGYNRRLDLNEDTATAREIMDYLYGRRYAVSTDYEEEIRFLITSIRYRMGFNSYQKYIQTTIAKDVSPESVAYVMENKYRFTGVDIEEQSIRVYEEAECFANLIGYTGTISTEEYEALKVTDDSYSLTDIVGKSGIEQYMNKELMGKKGYQTVFVDSLGNLLETADLIKQQSGSDVYLSIDKDLTVKTYRLLEQQIAGILYSKIINEKTYDRTQIRSRDDVLVPVYDVYYALIENRIVSITKTKGLSDAETALYAGFNNKFEAALSEFTNILLTGDDVIYSELPREYRQYSTYLVKKLKSDGVFDETKIDDTDPNQKLWTGERMSVSAYIKYAIEKSWIGIERFVSVNQYVDTSQVYESLVSYAIDRLRNDSAFKREVYEYAIMQDEINIPALMATLYDQGIIPMDEAERARVLSGEISPYNFIRARIKELEITPGQLGLDPCSGSCVIMEPNTGEVLALVTYPGYDSNRLANTLDSEYYAYLSSNRSSPLYNHATQERTAPGSTFKMISSVAGLAEGVIDTNTLIKDGGVFEEVSNRPECWIYPANTHGEINLTYAIRHSCNYFFYEVGYRLAGSEAYNDHRGIESISKYAELFGMGEKTGIEIEESQSSIATEYPVMAAIGQSNNNYTTISLARYISAVATRGDVYNLTLLKKIVDKDGKTTAEFGPELRNNIDVLSENQWDAISTGMELVVDNLATFKNFPVEVAGKTGTAQQSASRPNHSLFVGYAPAAEPEISIACRIPYGYTSANAADFCRKVLAEYFEVGDYDAEGQASDISTNNRITD